MRNVLVLSVVLAAGCVHERHFSITVDVDEAVAEQAIREGNTELMLHGAFSEGSHMWSSRTIDGPIIFTEPTGYGGNGGEVDFDSPAQFTVWLSPSYEPLFETPADVLSATAEAWGSDDIADPEPVLLELRLDEAD